MFISSIYPIPLLIYHLFFSSTSEFNSIYYQLLNNLYGNQFDIYNYESYIGKIFNYPFLFSGTTGALLLFDESLYQFCQTMQIDFLSTRVYIGLWLAVIGVGVACFEGSLFVKLFSRFVEDIFSSLIVLLYILESVQKVIYFYKVHPLLPNYCEVENIVLATKSNDFYSWNDTSLGNNTDLLDMENNSSDIRPIPVITRLPMTNENGEAINQPNTALFCTILTLGTFGIAYYLKIFRNSQFFGRSVSIISNHFTALNVSCKIVLFVIRNATATRL